MQKYLVIRLSAMGDVALASHVINSAIEQNPNAEFVVLTRDKFNVFFGQSSRISFVNPDLYGKHKGFVGLLKLWFSLRKAHKFTAVLDLHNVLRSKVLRLLYRIVFTPVYVIEKGRREKKALINKTDFKQLPHATERYAKVFLNARLALEKNSWRKPVLSFDLNPKVAAFIGNSNNFKVGLAPFASTAQKAFPQSKLKELVSRLAEYNVQMFVFGGGKTEEQQTEALRAISPKLVSLVGKLKMTHEIAAMQQMNVVFATDSSNMHLAGLVGTPVVSVWGGTHPYAGFSPINIQNKELMVQVPVSELPCRPCSVFGNIACHRSDLACLHNINIDAVMAKILAFVAPDNTI